MSDTTNPAVLNAFLTEFGDNASFALELYAQYRLDPASVGESWKQAFRDLEARVGAVDSGGDFGAPRAPLAPAAAPAVPVPVAPPAPPRPPAPAPRPGEEAVPLTGGAATIARNMEASL